MTTIATTMIVWDGCDGYIELADAARAGYNVKGTSLYTQREEFHALPAVEVDPATLPTDDDGELICDGLKGSESGKLYRAV